MKSLSVVVYVRTRFLVERNLDLILALFGLTLLVSGMTSISHAQSFDDSAIRDAICQLLMFQEGAFGALVMVVAGIGAIVSSAFGAYRAATSLIVVACGSFILRSLVTLFFDSSVLQGQNCGANTIINIPAGG